MDKYHKFLLVLTKISHDKTLTYIDIGKKQIK